MFWKRFDKHKPKKKGWYYCTIEFYLTETIKQTYTMDLYWYPESQSFKDNRRENVFTLYDVHGYDIRRRNELNLYDVCGFDIGNEKERLHTDILCDRTDEVIAWRKCPKPYKRFKFMKRKREELINEE